MEVSIGSKVEIRRSNMIVYKKRKGERNKESSKESYNVA